MTLIEVGGKEYEIDVSQITIGDYLDAMEKLNSKVPSVQAEALTHLLRKALGQSIYEISMVHYGYLVSRVMELLVAPLTGDAMDDQLKDILDGCEDEDAGV